MKISYRGISIEGEKDEVLDVLERILEENPTDDQLDELRIAPGFIDDDPYEKIPYWERPGYRAPQITCQPWTGQNPLDGQPQIISVYGINAYR